MIASLEWDEGKNGGVGPIDGEQNDRREGTYVDPTVQDLGFMKGGIGCYSGWRVTLGSSSLSSSVAAQASLSSSCLFRRI
ncbi:SWI/SNF complex subunit SWI3C [Pyrus ussuriensis x Pyrus communis]|uniref:SWI/SNF complex subunit SWI3C n=1 Tax=Pyrus ussuriensis x Pyrus communis TaxID=2448454 RepID=A0A5N5FF49_9ROSA|nr:SWI/SNF complex subunit SWI3C [Pyrus ussuriensis x Pyrus communis]